MKIWAVSKLEGEGIYRRCTYPVAASRASVVLGFDARLIIRREFQLKTTLMTPSCLHSIAQLLGLVRGRQQADDVPRDTGDSMFSPVDLLSTVFANDVRTVQIIFTTTSPFS